MLPLRITPQSPLPLSPPAAGVLTAPGDGGSGGQASNHLGGGPADRPGLLRILRRHDPLHRQGRLPPRYGQGTCLQGWWRCRIRCVTGGAAASAWNDNGIKSLVKDPRALYRSDFFPGLGWMLSRYCTSSPYPCPAGLKGSVQAGMGGVGAQVAQSLLG